MLRFDKDPTQWCHENAQLASKFSLDGQHTSPNIKDQHQLPPAMMNSSHHQLIPKTLTTVPCPRQSLSPPTSAPSSTPHSPSWQPSCTPQLIEDYIHPSLPKMPTIQPP
ncbi:hypothetical protein KC19_6G179400 [Ceratodon purpureus]|uniref:Uncharacterized protein n=1 Tax=Ceratodon purpureus TaxID=3225 RepID=A0A8T0HJ18_CERPU|nr:hypothetical protein KC19_6G179400 [Ceratodon purpureus]